MHITMRVIDREGLWQVSKNLLTIFEKQGLRFRTYCTGSSEYIIRRDGIIEYKGPEELFGKSKYIQFVRKRDLFGMKYYVRFGAILFELDPNSINKELFDRLLTTKGNTT